MTLSSEVRPRSLAPCIGPASGLPAYACPVQQPTLTSPAMRCAGCVSPMSTCPMTSDTFDETAPELLAQGADAHALRAAAATYTE